MGASHSQAHQLAHQHSPGPPGALGPAGGAGPGHGQQGHQGHQPRPHWAHSFPRDLRRSASSGDAGPAGPHLGHGGPVGPSRALPEHCKVLPVPLGPGTRLHRTENGDILHSGGTISGRRHAAEEFKDARPGPATGLYRARSQSHHRERERPDRRYSGQGLGGYGPRGGSGYASGGEGGGRGMTGYGSEPDLRQPKDGHGRGQHRDMRDDSPAKLRISRSRKKYKAPAPPPGTVGVDSSSPDSYQWERTERGERGERGDPRMPTRRNRLFKTRAETKRGAAAPPTGPPTGPTGAPLPHRGRSRDRALPSESPSGSPTSRRRHPGNPPALQRSLSTPEFQVELLEVARRLRNALPTGGPSAGPGTRQGPVGEDHGDLADARVKVADAIISRVSGRGRARSEDSNRRGEGSGRESTPEPVNSRHSDERDREPVGPGAPSRARRSSSKHWEILPSSTPKASTGGGIAAGERPVRTFYFGMDESDGISMGAGAGRERERERERRSAEVERFAAEIRRASGRTPGVANNVATSGSASVSSEPDREEESVGGIALQLRPTLPKKRLEIPRFSPTAAWRQLSSQDGPGGAPSPLYPLPMPLCGVTDGGVPGLAALAANAAEPEALDELEERIHRLSRPTAPIPAGGHPAHQALAHQALHHDKSGDSGISGDASPVGGNEDSSEALGMPGLPRKAGPTSKSLVVAWTPQQDLEGDEESSSDGELESPVSAHASRLGLGLGPGPAKFSPRSHLFSLSLPRDNQLSQYSAAFDGTKSWSAMTPPDEASVSFHSLRNVRRSLGIGGRRETRESCEAADEVDSGTQAGSRPLDGNWLLSRSVPSSLNLQAPEAWRHSASGSPSSPDGPEGPEHDDSLSLFRDVLKQPSFSYLATGGHVMYLPDFSSSKRFSDRDHRERSRSAEISRSRERERERNLERDAVTTGLLNGHRGVANGASVREMRELGGSTPPSPSASPSPDEQSSPAAPQQRDRYHTDARKALDRKLRSARPKRFTFQSTLRQIERRRIAEKLSRDAELKEQQRLSELEAMRRVEEEFQRKRAREKANIRHQLRLFNLEEHNDGLGPIGAGPQAGPAGPFSSLPMDWRDRERDHELVLAPTGATSAVRHRAEPDGAPAPASPSFNGNSTGKLSSDLKDLKASGGPGTPGTQVLSEYRQNQREYRDYRPSSCRILDTSIDSAHNGELNGVKRATVHPEAVFDIPKNTPVYVANHHHNSTPVSVLVESERGISTPRSSSSDNYRRDFAHGTVPVGGRSLASSDSELSQPNTRPTSRQGPGYYRPLPHLQRSRSASPQGNFNKCDFSPPSSRHGSPSRIPFVTQSSLCSQTGESKSTSPEDSSSSILDYVSEIKQQGSPEHSLPHGLPENKSTTSAQGKAPVKSSNDSEVDGASSPEQVDSDTMGSQNQSECSSKTEVNSSTFLGLQPFGKTKNKGYRPISFNPTNKLAQPVN